MVMTERSRVRMLSTVTGQAMPTYDIQGAFTHSEGETVDLHPNLATAWVNCGYAELVKAEKEKK